MYVEQSVVSPAQFVAGVCDRNREFYLDPRGRGALKDLQQVFSHTWLYVAELLQNAIDVDATEITMRLMADGALLFEHNGRAFSEENVEALCARGVSSKGAGTIGFMGVGFKSVFRSFETVQVSSGDFRFRLTVPTQAQAEFGDLQRDWLGAVLPTWDGAAESPSDGMTCRFVFTRRLSELAPTEDDLEHVLGDDECLLALLAWQGIQAVDWNGTCIRLSRNESALQSAGNEGERQLLLEATDPTGDCRRRWIMFAKRYQPSRRAIARFLEHRQIVPSDVDREQVYGDASRSRDVGVFCELDADGFPCPVDHGSAFALLPTGITFPIGLHVHADWLLVVTRREMMQVEGNQWQEEILSQIPRLLACFLKWLVTVSHADVDSWTRGYDVLPGQLRGDEDHDRWFASDAFRDGLRSQLRDLPFVPIPANDGTTIEFLAPNDAVVLPRPLAATFAVPHMRQRVLFGNQVACSRLLGQRAERCLQDLGFLSELSPSVLKGRWDGDALETWLSTYEPAAQMDVYCKLLAALADLDTVAAWKEAALCCLPTVSGGWTYRQIALRYPGDWNVLAREEELRTALEPFVGADYRLLAPRFDLAVVLSGYSAVRYLMPIHQSSLEDVVAKWWKSLPLDVDSEQASLVVHVTNWVRSKLSQRKKLIAKLLVVNESGTRELRPSSECLLAEPYAGGFRQRFFSQLPAVAPDYADYGGASLADWRSLFESLDPAPAGRFLLETTYRKLYSGYELQQIVGQGYAPPVQRVTALYANWEGQRLENSTYILKDFALPASVRTIFNGPSVSREEARVVAEWMNENFAVLHAQTAPTLAYIPMGYSHVQETAIPAPASWLHDLQDRAWVYSTMGQGPFRVAEVLAAPDPVRPDAPIADLPPNLLHVLKQAGIAFGANLPAAPAVDRLRLLGPTATESDLNELVVAAIEAARSDDATAEYLRRTLRSTELFPVPVGIATVDGVVRLPHGRLTRGEGGRSTLGNWVLPIDSVAAGTPLRKAIEAVDRFLAIPKTTTGAQAVGFLEWAWRTQPEIDRVRRVLPRAYDYVRADMDTDGALVSAWSLARPSAAVYVQGKRDWAAIDGSEGLSLDDIGRTALTELLGSVDFATPSHLGETIADQAATAAMIGLSLLSTRYRIEVRPKGSLQTPEQWQRGFTLLQDWLRDRLRKGNDDDLDDNDDPLPERRWSTLELTRWESLRVVVLDREVEVREMLVGAADCQGAVAVSGEPADFAADAARVLLATWGLDRRKDLTSFLPDFTLALSRIDAPLSFSKLQKPPSEEVPATKSELPPNANLTTGDKEVAPEANRILPREPETSEGPEDYPSVDDNSVTGDDRAGVAGEGQPSTDMPSPNKPGPTTHRLRTGGSHTAADREAGIQGLIRRRNEIDRQIKEASSLGMIPSAENADSDTDTPHEPQSDDRFRHAVVEFERRHGRWAVLKDKTQSGHDIDSFTHAEGVPERQLVRRIEVKGKGLPWVEDEIVEMSDRQFKDAVARKVEEGVVVAPDFDYWLYVVEDHGDGVLSVVPIQNPAVRAAHFELRGGTWRDFADEQLPKDRGNT